MSVISKGGRVEFDPYYKIYKTAEISNRNFKVKRTSKKVRDLHDSR